MASSVLPFRHERVTERIVEKGDVWLADFHCVERSELNRLLIVNDGVVDCAFAHPDPGKTVLRQDVVGRDGDGVLPKRLCVLPRRDLSRRDHSEENDRRASRCGHSAPDETMASGDFSRFPCHNQIKADLRQVSVTIGVRL